MPSFNLEKEGFHAPNTSPPTSQDFRIGTLDLGNEASDEPQLSHILGYPHVSDNSAVLYQVNQLIDLNMSHQVISNNQGNSYQDRSYNQGIPINQVNGLRQFHRSGQANPLYQPNSFEQFTQVDLFHQGNLVNQGSGFYQGNPSYPVKPSYPVHTKGQVNMVRSFDQIGSFNMAAPNQVNPFCNVPRSTPQSFQTGVQMGTWNPGATIPNGSRPQAPHTLTNHTRSWITGAAVLNNPQPQVLHTSSNLGYAGYNPQNNLWVPPKRVRRSKVRSQVATTNMRPRPTTSILHPIVSSQYIPPLLYSTGVTLEEFRLFNEFPPEIRAMIWHLTMISRVVEVRISRRDAKDRGRQMYNFESFTPKPKVLSICPETRCEAMKYYKPMFAHEVNGVTRYIWVGPGDTVYFSFFRSGIGSNQSAATMLWTVFKKAGDYDRVAIPQGIAGKPKIYENSTVQFLTHVAVPLPFKNPHFKLLAELLVRCAKLKTVRLWNNVLTCTPPLDFLLRKRGQGKMMKINDVASITDPAKARHVGNFNEEQAKDHFLGWLKRYINKGDHPNGLTEIPLVELGRMEVVDDEQWREFLE